MYNASASIIRSLTSVEQQIYTGKIEILIINDGSKDDSVSLVEQYATENPHLNIRLFSQSNKGVSSTRNFGLREAKGDYIALLDADDEWSSDKLEKQMKVLMENTEIDFLGCARNNEVLQIFNKKIKSLHKATVKELFIKMYPQTSTAVFKKKLYEKFGGYNESMTHAEDGNLWIRYCANANFYYMPNSLVITGGGKPSFGHSGLSSNLKAMQKGNEFNFKEALANNYISYPFYLFIYFFAKMKYLRRILITSIR